MIPPARSHRDWVGEWAKIIELAAYGLQSGRYRITQMAKQKEQYDNTNDIVLDVWRSVLLAGYGMWWTLAGASGIIGNSGQR